MRAKKRTPVAQCSEVARVAGGVFAGECGKGVEIVDKTLKLGINNRIRPKFSCCWVLAAFTRRSVSYCERGTYLNLFSPAEQGSETPHVLLSLDTRRQLRQHTNKHGLPYRTKY